MRRILFFSLSRIKNSKNSDVLKGIRFLENNPKNQVEKCYDRKDLMNHYGVTSVPAYVVLQDGQEPEIYQDPIALEIIMVKYG